MQSAVHFGLAALLALPAIGCAQQGGGRSQNLAVELRTAQPDEPEAAESSRRLESVTWNSVSHELTWMISSGATSAGRLYQPATVENYQISLDDATMTFDGETRRFSTEEASNVHVLMDLIAKYAVDSTVWWEDGHGEPVNGNEPKEQRNPPKSIEPGDDGAAAGLRIAACTPTPTDLPALRLEIRRLEEKLAGLKRIERSATAIELAKD